MDWDLRPQRSPELEINETTDGFLVYQRDRDRLHMLNPAAILVLEACDGTLRARELPGLIAEAFGLAAPPTDDIAACIMELLREGLLVVPGMPATDAPAAPASSGTGG
jgi:hypothetical protein